MLRVLGIVLFLLVLLVGVKFSAVNGDPVTLNYFLGTIDLPLSLVVVCAFAAGIVVALATAFLLSLPVRWRSARMRREGRLKDAQINNLRGRLAAGSEPR